MILCRINFLKHKVLFSVICFYFTCACTNKENIATSQLKDILSLYPDYQIRPILANYKFNQYQWGDSDTRNSSTLTLLWFSDIHGNSENLRRITRFYDYYKEYIDDVLSTGDQIMHEFGNSDFDFWEENGAGHFLKIMGNHDCALSLSPFVPISPYLAYERYYKPFSNNDGEFIGENKCYWYKDYTFAKSSECPGGIRLIGIDQYHWKESEWSSITVYPDEAQIDKGQQEKWLNDLLNDAIEKKMAVIIGIHSPSNDLECLPINCSFDTLDRINNRDYQSLRNDVLEDVQSFIDRGGEFICWLGGHTHQDWFTQLLNYPNQIQIVVGTASYNMTWRDCEMVYNSKYMDRFNIISIDSEKKYIRMFRIGVDHDRHGRHIGSIVYDYKNKVLISNQ